MRNGDFSALTNADRPARSSIYDPLTHQPFPGTSFPANRINPVAAAIIKYMPLPDVNVSNGSHQLHAHGGDRQPAPQEYSGKVEHKFTDKVSLTGFYLWNHTDEPCSNYFEVGKNGATRFADPNDYLLKRTPQILALNNTWVLSDSSVLALRFGWTRFVDNSTMTIDFDPSTLGFSPTFISQVGQTGVPKFPQGADRVLNRLQQLRRDQPVVPHLQVVGARTPASRSSSARTPSRWAPTTGRLASYLLNPGNASGRLPVRQGIHLVHRAQPEQHDRRRRVRQLPARLSRRPTAARQSTMTLTTPLDIYTQLLRRLLCRTTGA